MYNYKLEINIIISYYITYNILQLYNIGKSKRILNSPGKCMLSY